VGVVLEIFETNRIFDIKLKRYQFLCFAIVGGAQYAHCMTYKCIMVKLGETKTRKFNEMRGWNLEKIEKNNKISEVGTM